MLVVLISAALAAAAWAAVSRGGLLDWGISAILALALILEIFGLVRSRRRRNTAVSAAVMNEKKTPTPAPEILTNAEELRENSIVLPAMDQEQSQETESLVDEFRALAPRVVSLSRYVMTRSEEAATHSTESAFGIAEDARNASSRVAELLSNVNCGDDCLEGRISALSDELESFTALIGELNEVIDGYDKSMGRMEALSNKVTEHTMSIQDIAERTGILSINASIEAARAGESGKGFTVIAQEVRKLSDTTSALTEKISGVIDEFGRTVSESSTKSNVKLHNMLDAIGIIKDNLNNSVEVLKPQVESVAMSVTEAESLTGSVSSRLDDVGIWFQTQDALRQTIEHISDAVLDLGSRCDARRDAAVPENLAEEVQRRLTDRFTVADEWEALGLETPAGDTDITLF